MTHAGVNTLNRPTYRPFIGELAVGKTVERDRVGINNYLGNVIKINSTHMGRQTGGSIHIVSKSARIWCS